MKEKYMTLKMSNVWKKLLRRFLLIVNGDENGEVQKLLRSDLDPLSQKNGEREKKLKKLSLRKYDHV
jgi:hypothetical protein